MTYYRPCKNCLLEKEPCPRRDAVRAALKGTGVTSAAFRCNERKPIFAIGQRVTVTWLVPEHDEYGGYENGLHESWPATVIAERGTKFQIVVDDVASDEGTRARAWMKNESLHAKVTAPKLKALDEPNRELCPSCQAVVQPDGSVVGCWNDEISPARCLKRRAAQ